MTTKPNAAKLFEALDTACGLLDAVGVDLFDGHGICRNCCCDWDTFNPGNPDAHCKACDMPDVFAVRDEYRAGLEREARRKDEAGLDSKEEDDE